VGIEISSEIYAWIIKEITIKPLASTTEVYTTFIFEIHVLPRHTRNIASIISMKFRILNHPIMIFLLFIRRCFV